MQVCGSCPSSRQVIFYCLADVCLMVVATCNNTETGGNSQPELSNSVSTIMNKWFIYRILTLNLNNEVSVNVC